MFSSRLFVSVLALALSVAQVNAHAAIAPALGVSGSPVRNDVQRPSTNTPCGTVNIAQNIDTSTAIPLTGSTFQATVTDFNAGADGSRSVSAQVDATGAGKSFTAATVTTNGNANPTTVGSDQVTVQMPAGTTCTGGAAGNLCLVSFKTTAGFGNCVVVSQGAATGAAATNGTTAAGTAAAASGSAAAGNTTTTATGTGKKHHKGANAAAKAAAKAAAAAKQRRGGSLRALEARWLEKMSEIIGA